MAVDHIEMNSEATLEACDDHQPIASWGEYMDMKDEEELALKAGGHPSVPAGDSLAVAPKASEEKKRRKRRHRNRLAQKPDPCAEVPCGQQDGIQVSTKLPVAPSQPEKSVSFHSDISSSARMSVEKLENMKAKHRNRISRWQEKKSTEEADSCNEVFCKSMERLQMTKKPPVMPQPAPSSCVEKQDISVKSAPIPRLNTPVVVHNRSLSVPGFLKPATFVFKQKDERKNTLVTVFKQKDEKKNTLVTDMTMEELCRQMAGLQLSMKPSATSPPAPVPKHISPHHGFFKKQEPHVIAAVALKNTSPSPESFKKQETDVTEAVPLKNTSPPPESFKKQEPPVIEAVTPKLTPPPESFKKQETDVTEAVPLKNTSPQPETFKKQEPPVLAAFPTKFTSPPESFKKQETDVKEVVLPTCTSQPGFFKKPKSRIRKAKNLKSAASNSGLDKLGDQDTSTKPPAPPAPSPQHNLPPAGFFKSLNPPVTASAPAQSNSPPSGFFKLQPPVTASAQSHPHVPFQGGRFKIPENLVFAAFGSAPNMFGGQDTSTKPPATPAPAPQSTLPPSGFFKPKTPPVIAPATFQSTSPPSGFFKPKNPLVPASAPFQSNSPPSGFLKPKNPPVTASAPFQSNSPPSGFFKPKNPPDTAAATFQSNSPPSGFFKPKNPPDTAAATFHPHVPFHGGRFKIPENLVSAAFGSAPNIFGGQDTSTKPPATPAPAPQSNSPPSGFFKPKNPPDTASAPFQSTSPPSGFFKPKNPPDTASAPFQLNSPPSGFFKSQNPVLFQRQSTGINIPEHLMSPLFAK